jgi:Uma2 family endonuclease
LSFFSEAKRALLDWNLRVQRFVPDLAIEIVSTNDTFQSLVRKAQRYRDSGTREVWIFDLENRQAYVYSESRRAILDEHDEFRSESIPGFAMRIADMLSRY